MKTYRFYNESKLYLSSKFPFIHFAKWKTFLDQVPADKESKLPKNIKLLEVKRPFIETAKKLKFLQEGDIVEFYKGGIGKITGLTFASNNPNFASCCVTWNDYKLRGNPANSDDPKKGPNVSISLPAIDLGRKFNPIIRLYKK